MKIKGFADTIRWYNKNASTYSQSIQNIPSSDQIDKFILLLPNKPLVLDAGCASGRDSKIMFDKGMSVVGVDISGGLISIAKRKYPEIQFIEGNFLHLPFEDNHFNGVWAQASLLHFDSAEDVIKSIEEFYLILKPGGILHVSVKEKIGIKYEVVKDTLSNHERFFQFFTTGEIKKYVTQTGFKVINLSHTPDPAGRKEVRWILILAKK